MKDEIINNDFYKILAIIDNARSNALKAVNTELIKCIGA